MSAANVEATRAAGLSRLQRFVVSAGSRYTRSRNFDFGPDRRSNVSILSPYIRHRLVLEHEVLQATLRIHPPDAAQKFVQEVFWRAYFKGWLEQRPAVWADYRRSLAQLLHSLESDADALHRYESAVAGNTGIDCFDAWVNELIEYGYLHNHARMWFASIWVFTLDLPWQLGADFFYRHLVDGDPASNTLSWRWVSGLHTPGKTYLARASNIATFTDNRFRPDGQLATRAPALTEQKVYRPEPLPPAHSLEQDERFGLLITEDDCCPELILGAEAPVAVLGALATRLRSPLPVGTPATQFAAEAVSDAVQRASQTFGVDEQLSNSLDWGDMLLEWARQHQLKKIVTAYAPVGPGSELLSEAMARLARHDIRLLQLRRSYDSVVWPHARRGFFKLKERIPEMLDRIGIVADSTGTDKKAGPRAAKNCAP